MTGNDLIASALRLIGALASGETAGASESADAQVILNQMLDAWGAEHLMVFTLNRLTFSLLSGKQTYTLGVGGDFNTARPPRIDYVSIVNLANPALPLELPIKMYTDTEWQGVPVKLTSGSLPFGVYDDGGFPLRSLSYFPIPNIGVNTIIGGWAQLTQFADLTVDVTFPPGYAEAIKYNFSVRLAAEWPGNVSELTLQLASESKARIKSSNIGIVELRCDPGLDNGGGRYNWLTDSVGR